MNSKTMTRKASKSLDTSDIPIKRRNTLHPEQINFDKVEQQEYEQLEANPKIKPQTNITTTKKDMKFSDDL